MSDGIFPGGRVSFPLKDQPSLPGPEKPLTQGGRPYPHLAVEVTLFYVKGPTEVQPLCTTATMMTRPTHLGE